MPLGNVEYQDFIADNQGIKGHKRRAVKAVITDAAYKLFLERGYSQTTIEDIAAEVGMSTRNVFRYFSTREDIVLGNLDVHIYDMFAALRARPIDEPLWTSLRRMFDGFIARTDMLDNRKVSEPIQRMVLGTPALLARYLQKYQHAQTIIVMMLSERSKQAGPQAADEATLRVLTGAMFACVVAAQHTWLANDAKGSFADAVDHAAAVLIPVGLRSAD